MTYTGSSWTSCRCCLGNQRLDGLHGNHPWLLPEGVTAHLCCILSIRDLWVSVNVQRMMEDVPAHSDNACCRALDAPLFLGRARWTSYGCVAGLTQVCSGPGVNLGIHVWRSRTLDSALLLALVPNLPFCQLGSLD